MAAVVIGQGNLQAYRGCLRPAVNVVRFMTMIMIKDSWDILHIDAKVTEGNRHKREPGVGARVL